MNLTRSLPVVIAAALGISDAFAVESLPSREEARKLYTEQPRTVEQVREAAAKLTLLADANPQEYDDQWQAARAWEWLAEYEPKRDNREPAVKRAVALARRACQADPKRVEGHFYLAVSLGTQADLDRGFSALGMIGEMEKELNQAIEIDERFDEAGPHRMLGLLKLDAPGSRRGQLQAAAPHLRRAAELAPKYPENQIALARLLQREGDAKGALAALDKALASPPWPSKQDEDSAWKTTARQLRGKWAKP